MLTSGTSQSFEEIVRDIGQGLLDTPKTRVPEWQSLDVSERPQEITHELYNVVFDVIIPESIEATQQLIKPNLPWAEDHFLERVSGEPLNPPPSADWWPFKQKSHEEHKSEEMFSHTYPERFWPKDAGRSESMPEDRVFPRVGIRFRYGDLADVVKQLHDSPQTRQAYLPVWFPEDTGAVHGERVPCSLGYHFLIRRGVLGVTYFIRSCDFLRHFADDVYMAMRLGQWVRDQLNEHIPHKDDRYRVGELTMHTVNLHVFGGDMRRMEQDYGTKD